MQIDVIRNIEHLASLQEAWNQAVENSIFDSVFVTHEWFYSWAKNFITNDNMYIVVASDGDMLLGIMPLLLEQYRRGIWTKTILRSMSNLQTYKYNFVVRREGSNTILTNMFNYINHQLPWTTILLDFVPGAVLNVSLLKQLQGKCFYRIHTETHMQSPYVKIEGSWEEYLTSRGKHVKKNWAHFEHKLDHEGTAEVIDITGGPDLDQQIISAFDIEKSSWKGAQHTAIADSNAESGFYLDLGKSMSKCGKFRLHFLCLNSTKIAFDYCLIHKNHFNVLKTGYNPAYAKDSPGRVLHKKILRNLFQHGTFKVYDLLGTNDAWKAEWTTEAQTLLHIRIYNRRPTAIINCTLNEIVERTKDMLRGHPRLYLIIKKIYWRLLGQKPPTSGTAHHK